MSYRYGRDPWDYPLDNFKTLCFECHEEETELLKKVGARIKAGLRERNEMATQFIDSMFVEYENMLIQEALAERDERVRQLEDAGAVFDSGGRFYSLGGRTYDEDGNLL